MIDPKDTAEMTATDAFRASIAVAAGAAIAAAVGTASSCAWGSGQPLKAAGAAVFLGIAWMTIRIAPPKTRPWVRLPASMTLAVAGECACVAASTFLSGAEVSEIPTQIRSIAAVVQAAGAITLGISGIVVYRAVERRMRDVRSRMGVDAPRDDT